MDGATSPSSSAQQTPSKASSERWWKIFNKNKSDKAAAQALNQSGSQPRGVFGVSLPASLKYANVAISQVAPDGKARVYGHVPVVVAKTGLYLKEHGTSTEGVFRVPGNNRRIRDLEDIFNSPPLYGKDLTWDTYSVHDAGSILKRYLNSLPEPIIPFELYFPFQDALPRVQGQTRTQDVVDSAVEQYKQLINVLPPHSQHLLFYLLDVLAVFERKSDINRMTAFNLATILQPGLLRPPPELHGPPLSSSQPNPALGASTSSSAAAPAGTGNMQASSSQHSLTHMHSPSSDDSNLVKARIQADSEEHRKSAEVLEFLIQNQSSFELRLPDLNAKDKPSPQPQPQPQQSSSRTTAPPAPAATDASAAPTPAEKASLFPGTKPARQTRRMSVRSSDDDGERATSAGTSNPSADHNSGSHRRTRANIGRRNSERPTSEHHKRMRRKRQSQSSQPPELTGESTADPGADADTEPATGATGVRRARTLPSGSLAPSARKQQVAAAR